MERSQKPDVRNPLLALASAKALQDLPAEAKQALRVLLLAFAKMLQAKAEKCWRGHKAPMAAYWKACRVYAGHTSRLLREPSDTCKSKREVA